jgi:hypothetical protein
MRATFKSILPGLVVVGSLLAMCLGAGAELIGGG